MFFFLRVSIVMNIIIYIRFEVSIWVHDVGGIDIHPMQRSLLYHFSQNSFKCIFAVFFFLNKGDL